MSNLKRISVILVAGGVFIALVATLFSTADELNFAVRNRCEKPIESLRISSIDFEMVFDGLRPHQGIQRHVDELSLAHSWEYEVVFADGVTVQNSSGTVQPGSVSSVVLTIQPDGTVHTHSVTP